MHVHSFHRDRHVICDFEELFVSFLFTLLYFIPLMPTCQRASSIPHREKSNIKSKLISLNCDSVSCLTKMS